MSERDERLEAREKVRAVLLTARDQAREHENAFRKLWLVTTNDEERAFARHVVDGMEAMRAMASKETQTMLALLDRFDLADAEVEH